MPSWGIHLNIAQKLSENMEEKDKQSFLLGNILPDVNVGYLIQPISKQIPYTKTHYGRMQTFNGRTREFPDYQRFIQDYFKVIKEPLVLGYLSHLITDFYWNYNAYIQNGIYEDNKLVGLQYNKNAIFGDSEFLRKIKVNDFEVFSYYLYKNGIVQIPNFEESLAKDTTLIKQIHIEEGDIEGINKYFANIFNKIKTEEKVYLIYSLDEMEKCCKENIEFIQKIFQKLE